MTWAPRVLSSRGEARGLRPPRTRRVRLLAEHPERGDGACADSALCRRRPCRLPARTAFRFASQRVTNAACETVELYPAVRARDKLPSEYRQYRPKDAMA